MADNDWICPNIPRCEHPAMAHDVADYADPRPMCCVDGCPCGKHAAPSTSQQGDDRG
ncbi:hypothetical protein [Alloactinosynnema sp. L-07]|uniref:hypothetical protein n=1 Tax=Alloactinosynnema sp. L-07 TaxID=1653480 RepID=UPI00065F08A9|nr:hypothetical protein [Alloactinosynnema sp. L-07]CRK59033.1 hypothetical protein [Alloactinosynnema sp. L-07]